MQIPRRSVIRGVLGAGAAMLLRPLTVSARRSFEETPIVSGEMDVSAYTALRKTWFFFANMDNPAAGKVQLLRVTPLARDAHCEQYRLRFRPYRGLTLPSGRYHVTNWAGHPEFDVYVQAYTDRRGRQYLDADFAQLLAPQGGDS